MDEHGTTHYGDAVPPEYAKQGRSELNAQGVELRQLPRQLTADEADVAQKKAAAEARRRQHDSFLLTTYTKVSDIEQLRDERIALIDGQMEIARGSIESNQQHLKSLEQRLAAFLPYSTAPNAREKEKAQLRAQFNEDVTRYKELTTRPAGR